ncbi:unnamed protein product, partial [Iphiclides podalirius]
MVASASGYGTLRRFLSAPDGQSAEGTEQVVTTSVAVSAGTSAKVGPVDRGRISAPRLVERPRKESAVPHPTIQIATARTFWPAPAVGARQL